MRYKDKLPTSSILAGWKPDETFWPRLNRAVEPHIGKLDGGGSGALRSIVEGYFTRYEFVKNAPTINDALARVAELKKGAASFQALLIENPALDSSTSDAHQAAAYLINRSLRDHDPASYFIRRAIARDSETFAPCGILNIDPQPEPRRLALSTRIIFDLVGELLHACICAAKQLDEMKDQEFFRPGEPWDRFVSQLADFYFDLGRTPTASKTGPPSAFVCFVHAVQKELPKRFWAHPLATASTPEAGGEPTATLTDAVDNVLLEWRAERE